MAAKKYDFGISEDLSEDAKEYCKWYDKPGQHICEISPTELVQASLSLKQLEFLSKT